MGILDKLRSEFVDIVEWVDDSQHTMVWRFPRFHNQIKNGAHLLVRPGQTAILVSNGKIADTFEPGRYSFETKNIPVLSTLMGWKHGFDSPFKAEVYFVNTTRITDLKWGTPNPVIIRDPDFGAVRVRAFGTYSLRAVSPRILLRELVGTDSVFEADEISEWLRSIINMSLADAVARGGVGVLDLASRYTNLSETLHQAVQENIDDEYGLEMPKLIVVNISLPAEVEHEHDGRPRSVSSLSGGAAQGAASSGAMPPTLPTSSMWHVAQNGEATGPFVESQLVASIRAGGFRRETLVWCEGMANWMEASTATGLAEHFATEPPPLS